MNSRKHTLRNQKPAEPAEEQKRSQRSPSKGVKVGRTRRAVNEPKPAAATQQRLPSERVNRGKQPPMAPEAAALADNIYAKNYQYAPARGGRRVGPAARGVGRPATGAAKGKP